MYVQRRHRNVGEQTHKVQDELSHREHEDGANGRAVLDCGCAQVLVLDIHNVVDS
jgi:hypothetical protein